MPLLQGFSRVTACLPIVRTTFEVPCFCSLAQIADFSDKGIPAPSYNLAKPSKGDGRVRKRTCLGGGSNKTSFDARRARRGKGDDSMAAVTVNADDCLGCGVCVDACPSEALSVEDGVAVVDEGSCVECGACMDECPVGALAL